MTGCSPRAPTKRRGGVPEYLTFERVMVVLIMSVLACPEVHEWRMVEELGGMIKRAPRKCKEEGFFEQQKHLSFERRFYWSG